VCANEDDVRAQVRKTVIHEIAHHFGISDPRLDELGWRNSFASAATAPVWHRANTTPIVRPTLSRLLRAEAHEALELTGNDFGITAFEKGAQDRSLSNDDVVVVEVPRASEIAMA